MTLDEAYDRWERIARLMCENGKRSAIRSREQTERLKAYVDAVQEYYVTTDALERHPEDVNMKERLVDTKEILNRAREALRNTLRR